MSEQALQIEQSGAITWIWLNRPDVHNAFDAGIIAELTAAYDDHAHRPEVRAIVLAGRGKSFSAGAQAQWMKAQGVASVEDNAHDARKLANLFRTIAEAPKPTLARVHGAAMGGGVGLAAACDVAIGSDNAVFATQIAGPDTYLSPMPTAVVILKPDNMARNRAFCAAFANVIAPHGAAEQLGD